MRPCMSAGGAGRGSWSACYSRYVSRETSAYNRYMSEPTSTVAVYTDDLARLKRHQLRISESKGTWLTMPEIVRGLINAAEAKTEAGE